MLKHFRTAATALIGLLMVCAALPAQAVDQYVEGTHYRAIPIPVAPAGDEGVEVVEVFSYGCIHCYNFDPMVHAWAEANPDVSFRRTPAIFNASWALLAQAFYTAEALGVSDQMHMALFRAIHDRPVNLGDRSVLAGLFRSEAGVSEDAFNQAFDSFEVSTKVRQADGHGRAYRLRAVPSMVVDGKYLIDSSMVPGGNEEMLRVVDFLVERIEAERAATAAAGQ